MQTIKTKYHGPTNHRGARISAKQASHKNGKRIFVPYCHASNPVENHKRAAGRLRDMLNWNHCPMVPGDTDDGMIWVFTPRDNPEKIGTHAEPDPKVEALKKEIKTLSAMLLDAVGEKNLEAFIYNWSKNNA